MSEHGLERLLWEEIDGSLQETERRELSERLAADAGAERLRGEVTELARLLADAEDVAPPAELRRRIRTAVAGRPLPGASHAARRWWSPAVWAGGSSSRYAYLAAGIVIGIVSVLLVGRGMEPGSAALVGTVNVPAEAGAWRELPLADARGFVRLRRQADVWAVAFEVSDGPAISVHFVRRDGAAPEVRVTGSGGASAPVPQAGGVVLAGGASRRLSLEVDAAGRGEPPLRLLVESAGRTLLDQTLEATPR